MFIFELNCLTAIGVGWLVWLVQKTDSPTANEIDKQIKQNKNKKK